MSNFNPSLYTTSRDDDLFIHQMQEAKEKLFEVILGRFPEMGEQHGVNELSLTLANIDAAVDKIELIVRRLGNVKVAKENGNG